jgi:hypothetical protein
MQQIHKADLIHFFILAYLILTIIGACLSTLSPCLILDFIHDVILNTTGISCVLNIIIRMGIDF